MNNIDFEEIKKIIIPYFIEFYGEKYKDVIVERINKIIPIFYSKIENQKTEKNIKLEEEKIKLTLKFLNFLNINISEELKKKIILERSLISILNSENEQITNILKFYFGSKTYSKDRYFGIDKLVLKETDDKKIKKSNIEKLELLKIGVNEENYNEWVIGKEAEKLKEEIEKVKHFLITLDQEYDDFEKEYVNLNERIDKFDEVKRMLEQKYILLFLGEIKEFLPEQDKILLIKYLKSYKKDWYSLISNLNILKIVGSSFNIDGLIKSFGKEATEKLNNPKISKFQKNNILNDRIDYYKLIGIYNEKVSLEDFMNSKEAIENTPTSSFVDKITAIKEKYNKLFQNELLEMTSTYRTDMNTLNNLNLLDFDEIDVLDVILNNVNCIMPCLQKTNDNIELVPILFFSKENSYDSYHYKDVFFIHEINHVLELTLLDYKDNKCICKTGFDYLKNEGNKRRKYEIFSETINQLIAIKITERMHKDNIYLFNNKENAKLESGTSYEQQNIFVIDFWNQFYKYIIKARIDNNLDSLFEVIGKDNFNKLNDVINEYAKIPYLSLVYDVVNNIRSENVIKKEKLLLEKDEILYSMIQNLRKYEEMNFSKLSI